MSINGFSGNLGGNLAAYNRSMTNSGSDSDSSGSSSNGDFGSWSSQDSPERFKDDNTHDMPVIVPNRIAPNTNNPITPDFFINAIAGYSRNSPFGDRDAEVEVDNSYEKYNKLIEDYSSHRVKNPVKFHTKLYNESLKVNPFYKTSLLNYYYNLTKDKNPELLQNLQRIVNIEHLLNREETGGYHFCQTTKQFHKLTNIREAVTGVFQAFLPGKSNVKAKTSTFFPQGNQPGAIADAADLIQVVLSARKIASKGNTLLCEVPNYPFKIETYRSGPVVKSAFPVFYYATYNPLVESHLIEVKSEPILSKTLLETAKTALTCYYNLIKKQIDEDEIVDDKITQLNPIRYKIENDVIFEVAENLPILEVAKGIFIRFSMYEFTGKEQEMLNKIFTKFEL